MAGLIRFVPYPLGIYEDRGQCRHVFFETHLVGYSQKRVLFSDVVLEGSAFARLFSQYSLFFVLK